MLQFFRSLCFINARDPQQIGTTFRNLSFSFRKGLQHIGKNEAALASQRGLCITIQIRELLNHEHVIANRLIQLHSLHFIFREIRAHGHFKSLREAHRHQHAIYFGELADG